MARKVSTQEMAQHVQADDIWIVVNGKVYDVTEFAPNHPGGAESMGFPDPRIQSTRAD